MATAAVNEVEEPQSWVEFFHDYPFSPIEWLASEKSSAVSSS